MLQHHDRPTPPSSRLDEVWRNIEVSKRQGTVVGQVVSACRRLIDAGALRPGGRMPSVRVLSRQLRISAFSIAQAYDRLVAAGHLTSRPGSGFFVATTTPHTARPVPPPADPTLVGPAAATLQALSPLLYQPSTAYVPLGAGWLPATWHREGLIQEATRRAVRLHPDRIQGYGDAQGLPDLRALLAQRLAGIHLRLSAQQILLTHGATQALDLVLRTCLSPGAVVLAESPGYLHLPGLVEQHRGRLVSVRRDADGLDLDQLAALARRHRPALVFVQTALQNPLGTSLSADQAHRLLALAEQHDFLIIEDDVFRELAPPGTPSLAGMDGLRRVIRLDSTAKVFSPFVRVGSVCASPAIIAACTRTKMMTALTSSELEARVACEAMQSSQYRRALTRLRERLELAQHSAPARLRTLGLQPLAQPDGGMFISASWPGPASATRLTALALQRGILLPPGQLFGSLAPAKTWFRFNVAHLDHPKVEEFFLTLAPHVS